MNNMRLGIAKNLNKLALAANYAAMCILQENEPNKPKINIPVHVEQDSVIDKFKAWVIPDKPIVYPVKVIVADKPINYFNLLELRYEFFS